MTEGRKGEREGTSTGGKRVKCSAQCCASLICPFDENIRRTGEHETGSNSRRSRRRSKDEKKPKKIAARTHPGQQKVFFNLIFFTFHFCVFRIFDEVENHKTQQQQGQGDEREGDVTLRGRKINKSN